MHFLVVRVEFGQIGADHAVRGQAHASFVLHFAQVGGALGLSGSVEGLQRRVNESVVQKEKRKMKNKSM